MTVINEADKLYLGAQAVDRVYAGANLIWPVLPTFKPTDFPGLKIWLNASQLGLSAGADVSPWPNLAAGATGTMVGTPVPKMSTNSLNNLPLVRFTVSEGRMRMTGIGVDKAFTLVSVTRMVPGGYSNGRILTAAYAPTNFLIGFWNGFEDVGYTTTGGFFMPDVRKSVTTNWRLYSADAAAPPNFFPRMFNNGVLLSSGGGPGGGAGGEDSFSGTFNLSGYDPSSTSETCDCEVAEVVLYDNKLADADRQQVEAYLRTKWGL